MANLEEIKSVLESTKSHVSVCRCNSDLQELLDADQPLLLVGKRKLKEAQALLDALRLLPA